VQGVATQRALQAGSYALPYHARELPGVRPLPQDVAPVHIIVRRREGEATRSLGSTGGWPPVRTARRMPMYLSFRTASQNVRV
jgi:hypothetical protein